MGSDVWTWRYRRGAFDTREQKRLVVSPHGDGGEMLHAYAQSWVYSLTGVAGEELVLYKGFQTSAPSRVFTHEGLQLGVNDQGRRVYMAMSRFFVAGTELQYLASGNKELHITDNQGNVRTIFQLGYNSPIRSFDYKPFGEKEWTSVAEDSDRKGFAGSEYDSESDYYAMGYRMYSAEFGRFLAVDPLFEAMPRHNPYHYSFNSPMFWSDPSGLVPVKEKVKGGEKLQMLQLPDLLFLGGLLLEMTNKEIANIYTDPQNDPSRVAERPIETIDGREGGGGGGTNGSFIGNIVTSVVNFFSNLFGGGDDEGEEIDDDIVSERILPINDKKQKEGDYCFVACIEALLEYNGFNNGTIPSQDDIASKDRTGNSGTDIQGIKAIMYAFGFSTSWDIFDNTFNFDDIRNSIDNNVPIIASTKADYNDFGLLNHAIIIKGYTLYNDGTFNIHTMDPAGERKTYTNLNNFFWTNSNGTKNSFIIYIRKIK